MKVRIYAKCGNVRNTKDVRTHANAYSIGALEY